MRTASLTLDGWYWPSHTPVTSLPSLGLQPGSFAVIEI